jgi:hypothetical protein
MSKQQRGSAADFWVPFGVVVAAIFLAHGASTCPHCSWHPAHPILFAIQDSVNYVADKVARLRGTQAPRDK